MSLWASPCWSGPCFGASASRRWTRSKKESLYALAPSCAIVTRAQGSLLFHTAQVSEAKLLDLRRMGFPNLKHQTTLTRAGSSLRISR